MNSQTERDKQTDKKQIQKLIDRLVDNKNSAIYLEQGPRKSRFPQNVSNGQTDISNYRVASLLKSPINRLKKYINKLDSKTCSDIETNRFATGQDRENKKEKETDRQRQINLTYSTKSRSHLIRRISCYIFSTFGGRIHHCSQKLLFIYRVYQSLMLNF